MINQGTIKNDIYVKQVEFSKAVLWMRKEISLTPAIVNKIKDKVSAIWFEDQKKNERWKIEAVDFFEHAKLKKVGQEAQYYIPIGLFDREIIKKIDIKPISVIPVDKKPLTLW